MMPHKYLLFFLAMAWAFYAPGFGQPEVRGLPEVVDGPILLTLPEVISRALQDNPGLQRSAVTIEIREADVDTEEGDFDPNLNATVSGAARYGGDGRDPVWDTGEVTSSASGSLTTAMTLYSGGENEASLERAQANLEASMMDFDRDRETLLFQTVSRYLLALLRFREIDIEQEELASRMENLERIRVDYENGIRIEAELLRQQAQVADSERRLAVAEQNYESSLLFLKDTLLIPSEQVVEIDTENEAWYEADQLSDPDAQASLNAVYNRSDLQAQRSRILAAEQNIRAAQSGKKPTLVASANLRTSYASQDPDGGFPEQFFADEPSVSAGLTLTIPIFDRRRTQNNVTRARLQYRQEELFMSDLMQASRSDLLLAVLNYDTAKTELQASRDQLRFSEAALEAEQARFEAGASTLLEVNSLRAERVNAAVAVERARFDLFTNRLDVSFQDGSIEALLLERLKADIPELEE